MDGIEWEIKCPKGDGKHTIERNIRKAATQSHYIIMDLRRIKLPEKQCLSEIEAFSISKPGIKKILVIKKNLEVIEFPDN